MEPTANRSRSDHSCDPTTQETPRKAQDDCVICLAAISERAIAVPCNHCSFDFICLVSWLQEQPKCPLCKIAVSAVEYDWCSPTDFKTFRLASESQPHTASAPARRGRSRQRIPRDAYNSEVDIALLRRRNVYRHRRFSLHIGSNRVSGFRNITPSMISQSTAFQSRARKWIRRELQVFDFLRQTGPSSPSRNWSAGRMNNAEYLLEYIIEVLSSMDARGGIAEDLLTEYLGRENAQLFLHELSSWLRSPYENLEDWDRVVQYTVHSATVEDREESRESRKFGSL